MNVLNGFRKRSKLVELLSEQALLKGDSDLASIVADLVSIEEFTKGESLIIQNDDSNNDIFFILTGSFGVLSHDRKIATCRANQAVGEMVAIDPKAKRSATVIAQENSLVARLEGYKFATLADKFPEIWKNLAIILSDRLRSTMIR